MTHVNVRVTPPYTLGRMRLAYECSGRPVTVTVTLRGGAVAFIQRHNGSCTFCIESTTLYDGDKIVIEGGGAIGAIGATSLQIELVLPATQPTQPTQHEEVLPATQPEEPKQHQPNQTNQPNTPDPTHASLHVHAHVPEEEAEVESEVRRKRKVPLFGGKQPDEQPDVPTPRKRNRMRPQLMRPQLPQLPQGKWMRKMSSGR